jgi:hypothetical protein
VRRGLDAAQSAKFWKGKVIQVLMTVCQEWMICLYYSFSKARLKMDGNLSFAFLFCKARFGDCAFKSRLINTCFLLGLRENRDYGIFKQ